MRVLITGGYGFIGSHVAEQFHKEGYEIHILDNLSTGKKENITFKHKSYILSIDDPKCREVFNSFNFDIVVHLAAQVSVTQSIINPTDDAKTNIIGLINILNFANEFNVKKFIFASSAAVYGNNTNLPISEDEIPNPISPYGMSKWVGEQYCKNWGEQFNLEIVCFRFSNVYGPRQTNEGEGGVISIFTSRVLQNQKIQVHGDGTQTRDFIFVKDVAFAIYRASQGSIEGVYNLCTNTEISVNNLVSTLENLHGELQIDYTAPRLGDIYKSSLDNREIKKQLDWSPIYSIEVGLLNTYEWAKQSITEVPAETKKKESTAKLKWLETSKPYVENILFFTILSLILINISLPLNSIFFFSVFYIMVIGSIYGNGQAFFSVVLSFSLLVYDYLQRGRELVSLLYDTSFLFQTAIFIFIGLVIGYSVQRKNIAIQELSEQVEEINKRYSFLEGMHTEVRDVKNELQFRMKTSEDSFGKIYSIIKELDNLEPEKIFINTVNVIKKIMYCEDVSIYTINTYQSFLRLVAHSDSTNNQNSSTSLKVADTPYVLKIIQTGKPYFNRTLEVNTPLMAVPIFHNQEIRAIITINNLPFEKFSRYHENLFVVVKELIQSSLSRAFEFIRISEKERYIEDTSILKPEKFDEILTAKIEARRTHNIPFLLLMVDTDNTSYKEDAKAIGKMLRETDYLGLKDNQILILLTNTAEKDLSFISNRFTQAGFKLETDEKVLQL